MGKHIIGAMLDMEHHIGEALKNLAEVYPEYDIKDSHNIDTPKRIARMWLEMSRGYGMPDFDFTTFPNESENDNWIIQRNIEFSSMCQHHFMPFFGIVHIAYKPSDVICGLSKLPRVVNYFATRPQVQERLGDDILHYLQTALKPEGLIVVVQAKHTCVGCRGIKSRNTETITTHAYNTDHVKQFVDFLVQKD